MRKPRHVRSRDRERAAEKCFYEILNMPGGMVTEDKAPDIARTILSYVEHDSKFFSGLCTQQITYDRRHVVNDVSKKLVEMVGLEMRTPDEKMLREIIPMLEKIQRDHKYGI